MTRMSESKSNTIIYERNLRQIWAKIMGTLKEIESAVSRLSVEELTIFRDWFAVFDAEAWDRQFEADVATGKLDSMAQRALQHLREGRLASTTEP
jgi:hypothetical protein